MATIPDREKEFSETNHREYDVGSSTNVIELEYLAEQEKENDAYGVSIIIEYKDKDNELKYIQTEVWDINDIDGLLDSASELEESYGVEPTGMTVVFIS